MASIKVGIIGYGSSTKVFHLPFILPNPDLQVYAFLQRAEAPSGSVEAGRHCTIDHPQAKHYRTPEDFFADGEIELVIVCTGHNTHASFAEKALSAGKHVVVEKPFTITSAEADHLIALSKEKNKVLTCFQNRRYDSDFRTLHSFVKQGVFGKVTEFTNHYDVDNPDWIHGSSNVTAKSGDGLLYGLGSHSIDQTLQLFGPPESVIAVTRSVLVANGTDDTFTILLQYGGDRKDLLATIKTSVVNPLPLYRIPKYSLRGTHGSFIKTGEDPQIEQLVEGKLHPTDEDFGVEPSRYHAFVTTMDGATGEADPRYGEIKGRELHSTGTVKSLKGSYMDYYRDVVAAVRGEGKVIVTAEEARDVIRLIELARESAGKGGVPVKWEG